MSVKEEVPTPTGEGSNSGNTNDTSALLERIEKLEASNKRLLEESKGYKEKYKSVANEVEEKEKKIALEKGDLQKLLEMERAKVQQVSSEAQKLRESVLKSTIRQTVAKHAVDVYDHDDLLNQPQFAHILKEAIDPEALSVDETKVKEYVSEVLKAKPYMKKNSQMPGVVTKKPGSSANGSAKSLDEMSGKEIEALIRSKFSN